MCHIKKSQFPDRDSGPDRTDSTGDSVMGFFWFFETGFGAYPGGSSSGKPGWP